MAELLLELLSEEIPARMQRDAADDLQTLIRRALRSVSLTFDTIDSYVTPRRLVIVVNGLVDVQADWRETRRGPRADAPKKAIEGFSKSVGLEREQLEERETEKGRFLFAVIERKGRSTAELLADKLPRAAASLPWPKSMRWGAGEGRWVRPLHRILCLFDGTVVPFGFGDHQAGDATEGHRFMAPEPFSVKDFADYRDKLRAAYVMLDAAERRRVIEQDAKLAAEAEGLTVKPDPGLVAETAGLVEWPVVLMGAIDPEYMDLPPEVLTTAMRHHLKHFALLDKNDKLAPKILLVSNMKTKDGGKQIIAGNERVLRARLADAKFFWDQDRKRTLESRIPDLDKVVFHAKLGSVGDKVRRIEELAGYIGADIGTSTFQWTDIGDDAAHKIADGARDLVPNAEFAARLCKADLVSSMVGEFPELQGAMGRYYALDEGKDAAIADAIAEHYSPRGPNDKCPSAPASVAVALADKIDSLVGFWAIDEKPTGSKDPFALRRAALGVIRLVIENNLRVSLYECFAKANELYPPEIRARESVPSAHIDIGAISSSLLVFVIDRLNVHLREKGTRHDLISAVFAIPRHGGGLEDDLFRLLKKVDAVEEFLAGEDGTNLLTAYKRAGKILCIEETRDGHPFDGSVDNDLLSQKEEIVLHQLVSDAEGSAYAAVDREDFRSAMVALSMLRTPVDSFFDNVTVNVENDDDRRANRLALLRSIMVAMNRVADFSRIVGGER